MGPSSSRQSREGAPRRSTATCATKAGSTTCPTVASRSSATRSEEHTSDLLSRAELVCRLLLEKKKYWRCQRLQPIGPAWRAGTDVDDSEVAERRRTASEG